MRLYLVRHAEAAPGEPDALRPLTAAGREAARALGKQLAAEGLRLDAVLTSPLLRARQTGEALARAAGIASTPDDRLAPGATAADVRAAVAGRGDVVAVVGHQPDCSSIASALTGGPEPPFPPAGMLAIDVQT
ncbi:MAG: histidine phosphatase family protein [Actinobacteria bacterium]|nr:histidine phosphatase family protein [Actinomycetota bacterium]